MIGNNETINANTIKELLARREQDPSFNYSKQQLEKEKQKAEQIAAQIPKMFRELLKPLFYPEEILQQESRNYTNKGTTGGATSAAHFMNHPEQVLEEWFRVSQLGEFHFSFHHLNHYSSSANFRFWANLTTNSTIPVSYALDLLTQQCASLAVVLEQGITAGVAQEDETGAGEIN
ncbi:unnamed protein product, partial [Amoebophrya sp. A120]|eukprot:GSA120T00023886001.1